MISFFYLINNLLLKSFFYISIYLINLFTGQTLKPGSHLCDKHNTSDISISISTRKGTCPFFSCAYSYAYFTCVMLIAQVWTRLYTTYSTNILTYVYTFLKHFYCFAQNTKNFKSTYKVISYFVLLRSLGNIIIIIIVFIILQGFTLSRVARYVTVWSWMGEPNCLRFTSLTYGLYFLIKSQ